MQKQYLFCKLTNYKDQTYVVERRMNQNSPHNFLFVLENGKQQETFKKRFDSICYQ